MPAMKQLMVANTELAEQTISWLTSLVNEWQLVADLSFSDLVLWVPDADPEVFWAAAQTRPNTGPTALEDDVVGEQIAYDPEHPVVEAFMSEQAVSTSDNKLQTGIPVDVHAVPIRLGGEIVAVMERHTNQMGVRAPGSLEDNYFELAEQITDMVAAGAFPLPGQPTDPVHSPRVGDGLTRVNMRGEVTYSTPNAVTAFRRLGLVGDLLDEHLPSLLRDLVDIDPHSTLDDAISGAMNVLEVREVDLRSGPTSVRMRFLPLLDADATIYAGILLSRDVTEVNKKERQLVTKDATIREIHHRVKNNLQTVAALLRMQSRRVASPEAKVALSDAMARVAAIAVVHETLSQSFDEQVDFDTVADKVLQMVGSVATTARTGGIHTVREGSFGMVPAKVATGLSLVVTELCQNAIEHGLDSMDTGNVRVVPTQRDGWLTVEVIDDGSGLPDDFDLAGTGSLGLSIVSTLMSDLGGTFELVGNETDGDAGAGAPGGKGAEGKKNVGSTARICLPLKSD